MPAIGIDLGTTNSCVAVWRCGQVEIIANDQGKRTTPSCVAFRDSERSIGELAKNLAAMNPTNTVFDVKRLMGKQWNDPMVQNFYLKQWPLKVQNVLEKPKIEVVSNGRRIQFSPEEISAMVLKKMKEIAEKYLGESVKDAVITVPAYFNDSQRQATIDAGRIAGLNVLGIINEPTAAALAYGLNKNLKTQRRVLIFDQGGGTTDVSILNIKNTVFEVLAKAGDTHLGGEDFDGKLFDYLCNDLKKKCSEDVKSNPRAIIRLKTAVTRLKEDLSTMNVATVFIDSLLPGYDYHVDVSRELFENICDDLFDQTLEPVVKVLEINKIDKMSIDDIVLVGGSTRIPKVQSILQNFFCGKKLNFTINPDEAVAYGAAIQAELLSVDKKISPILQKVLLFDITPFALGIEVRSKGLITIIEKNTKIPCRFTKEFLNSSENQTEIQINVFEGNDPIARNNNCIGGFLLSGVTPGALHTVKIDVTFDLDANGILHVTARDRTSGSSNEIKIIHNKGSLSREEIQQILLDADRLGKQDIKERQKLSAKSSLDKYISSLMQAVEDSSSTLNRSGKNQILSVCKETEHWINVNSHADADDYCKELQEIEEKCTSIMTQNKKRKTSLISTKSQGSKKNKK